MAYFLRQSAITSSLVCYLAFATGLSARLHEAFAHASPGHAWAGASLSSDDHDGPSGHSRETDPNHCPICSHLSMGTRTCSDPPISVAIGVTPSRIPAPTSSARPLATFLSDVAAPRAPPVR